MPPYPRALVVLVSVVVNVWGAVTSPPSAILDVPGSPLPTLPAQWAALHDGATHLPSSSGSLPLVVQYIVHRFLGNYDISLNILENHDLFLSFLENCGLTLFYDRRDDWGDVKEILNIVGRPLMVFALEDLPDGGGVLVLANDTEIPVFSTCSAYILLSQEPEGLRSLVLSEEFRTQLHYLGRFIFVTGEGVGSAKVILENEVMAWRPYALVISKVSRGDVDQPGHEYEVWTHHVFRDDVADPVYLVERWQHGRPTNQAHLFPDKLENFHGSELRAVTFEHAPSIVDVHDGAAGHHYDGIDIRLLQILSGALNFLLKIVNPSDGGKWGSPLANGSWSGLTGDLTQHRAHMGVANLFIHIHYLEVVDMTVAYDMEFGCFITPLPEPLPQWIALIYPFTPQVWMTAMVFLLLGTPVLFLVSRASHRLLHDETSWVTSFSQNVFYGTGIFFGVGMPQVPRSDVTRSYFIMWVWYGLLITVVYRSSLTAFLTIPLTQPPIDTLQQLVASSLPAWGATGLTFKKMLQENPDPMVQQLALRYQPVSGAEEGILLTAQRKYAMMENRQFLEYMIATNYTNRHGEETLHVMRECFLPFRIGMAMPKKAPYKPNFDKVVTRVVEAGLVRKWFSDILFNSRRRGSEEGEGNRSVTLTIDNLQGAWLVLGSGWLVSVVTFLVEALASPVRRGVKDTHSGTEERSNA